MTCSLIAHAPVHVMDSIAAISAKDSECVVVTGSHGGLSAAQYALAARPLLCVFNDAGVGKDNAGIAGLVLLEQNGIAACAVSHMSARIGVASSTLGSGVVTHANPSAMALGVAIGQCVAVFAGGR